MCYATLAIMIVILALLLRLLQCRSCTRNYLDLINSIMMEDAKTSKNDRYTAADVLLFAYGQTNLSKLSWKEIAETNMC